MSDKEYIQVSMFNEESKEEEQNIINDDEYRDEQDNGDEYYGEEDNEFVDLEEYDDEIYNINSWGADLSFRELISLFKDEELIKPEIQRNYVWDKITASRFIESILLGLPIPSIFLAKMPDNRMLIVDGFQRVMSVYDFHNGIFKDGKTFKLSNSKKINPRWRGKSYKELEPSDQRKIRTTTIHAIIFDQRLPAEHDTSLYQIFERINTGGRSLSPQEIRNCVYHNQFNKKLIKLNKNKDWRKLFGLAQPDDRMKDIEFILRFFALQSSEISEKTSGQISLKKFLNTFMGDKNNNKEKTLEKFEKDFYNVMGFLSKNIGKVAFTNSILGNSEKGGSRFNGTVFDAIGIATNHVLKNPQLNPNFNDLKLKRKQLLSDPIFQDLLRNRTTNIDRINDRIDMASRVLYGVRYK